MCRDGDIAAAVVNEQIDIMLKEEIGRLELKPALELGREFQLFNICSEGALDAVAFMNVMTKISAMARLN